MPTLKPLPSITESAESEDLTLIEFEDGTSCYRTPEGGRKGKFPHSGIEFILRPRTLGDSQKLERAMGGQEEVQKFSTEAVVRMFCMCCTSFGTTSNCSPSQLYELDEAIDGMYLAQVISSFRTPARS
jgi:hypothetical protein